MVMIVLVVIINILITKFIVKQINPEEKINNLNTQIDELNSLTGKVNEYLDSKIEKQTQKVVDLKSESQDENTLPAQENTPTENAPTENVPIENAPTANVPEEDSPKVDDSPKVEDSPRDDSPGDETSKVEDSPKVEDVVIQQNDETTNMSDSQVNNTNCFVRTLTIDNINMFNNGSLANTTIQTAINNFISKFDASFEDLNTLPIGSIVYSIIPIHVSNDIFIHGRYYLRSLTNSNDPMSMIYNYQFQLPEHWGKASDFRFPNMKDRALQGKSKINFSLTDSEHKIETDNSIDVSQNV